MVEPIDFSKTQRIVLLIDLYPLLTFQNHNPNPYITTVLAAAKRIFTFDPLSNSLFAFKLFFSSLSPLRSASAVDCILPNPALTSLYFHNNSQTLTFLSTSLSTLSLSKISIQYSDMRPLASHIAGSLLQLIHDYAWESELENLRGGNEEEVPKNEFGANLGSIVHGIRKLGWGFCSTDSIVLGSALIPFGLIYPQIGVSPNFMSFGGLCKRSGVQLSLGILDVNGKPLECNCCDLELLNLENFPQREDKLSNVEPTEGFEKSENLCIPYVDGITKLRIKAVQRYKEGEKIESYSSYMILVHDFMGGSGKPKKRHQNNFFPGKVLNILSREMSELSSSNSMPIWQLILSFLYREGYWGLVSLSNGNGDAVLGILKPLTSHSALVTVIKSVGVCNDNVLSMENIKNEIHDSSVGISNSSGLIGSQTETSTSGNCESSGNGKKKRNRKHLTQDITWSSFCKAALECSEFDLAVLYFDRNTDQKKLKFLKCWMKQIIKYSQTYMKILNGSKCTGDTSISLNILSGPSGMQEETVSISCSETAETFFNSLPMRIQHGIKSKMDLPTLAERLVESSIHWSHQSAISETMEVQNRENIDDSFRTIVAKLMGLLLRDPKEMKDMKNCNDPSAKSSDPNAASEIIVREYELQVLLRMEILRSDISQRMEEHTKQKLLKQICSFLEIIQYLIEGGIHGNLSLYEYVEQTIRTRYYHALEDIVNKIYTQMDLLPFGDEDETQALLFNSEDSSQSWRDMKEMPEKAEMFDMHRSVSTEDEPCQPPENVDEHPEGLRREEQARKLSEARERRERARRFVSFTSWMPDLQRVWAPKQPKVGKGRSYSLHKDAKRKDRQTSSYSVVYETPMTGRKRPNSRQSSKEDDEHKDPANYSYSVSKALFQDS